jgi:hypothetical protein
MKNHFRKEALVMWVLAAIPVVGGVATALFVAHHKSWR